MKEVAEAAGAPKNCIQWIEHPSMDATHALMNHPDVATILATGGNAMVKAAYSCGKPAMGVGAGNVPAYMNKSCDVEQAVNDIVLSKSFDNGMICASEQAAIEETHRGVFEDNCTSWVCNWGNTTDNTNWFRNLCNTSNWIITHHTNSNNSHLPCFGHCKQFFWWLERINSTEARLASTAFWELVMISIPSLTG